MNQTNPEVWVHAPYGRDAALICRVLARSGISSRSCATVEDLCSSVGETTGAALISDQSLTRANVGTLAAVLKRQPPWSDLPLIITTSGGEATEASRARLAILEPLGNVTLLERPLRSVTLVTAVQTALRSRRRQYQLCENFTERERLVQELKRSNEELAEFAHVVSHDLQEPLRMVKTFSELLARRYRGKLDPMADEFIGTIQEGASTMNVLIPTLLNYATVGQQPMTRNRVDLHGIVDAVVTTLQPTIQELGAVVSHADLPTVHGDGVLLQQLIQNLVGNALKYCEPAVRPRVRISANTVENSWIISVEDNGQGISAENHERIFLPLKRLHGREISGTGLGLALGRKIVERHGGKMWVESELGKGATFFFTLPNIESNDEQKRASCQTEEGPKMRTRPSAGPSLAEA